MRNDVVYIKTQTGIFLQTTQIISRYLEIIFRLIASRTSKSEFTTLPRGQHFGGEQNCVVFGKCGPGGSVCIATDYGLEGPGSNPGGDEIFRPSKPTLGSTQPQSATNCVTSQSF